MLIGKLQAIAVLVLVVAGIGLSGAADNGDAARLAEQGIEPTLKGVAAFLHQLKTELADANKAAALIPQLGDANFRAREAAMQRLIEAPALPLKALQQAQNAADTELAVRARQVLNHPKVQTKRARAESLHWTSAAVLRIILDKQLQGVTPPLIEVVALLEDLDLLDLACEAAAISVVPADVPLLRQGLVSKNLNIRIAAVRGLGIAKVIEDATLRALLKDAEPRLALAAAHSLAERGDRASLEALVRLAAAKEESVRARSVQILRALSGTDFGFNPFQDPAAQKESLARWQAWVATQGSTAKLYLPLRLAPLPEDLGKGLLLHYTFDSDEPGRLKDSSGQQRHGSAHNAHSLVAGKTGKALEIQGAGDMGDSGGHALLPFIDFMALEQFTVALWVNERGMSESHGEAYVVFGADRKVGLEDSVGISHFNEVMVFRVGGAIVQTPFDNADRNKWVHYALTYQDGRIRAYKDGRFVGEAKGPVLVVGKQAALGRHWWHHGEGTSTRFIGAFDDVRIYQRALSPAQVELLRTTSTAKNDAGR